MSSLFNPRRLGDQAVNTPGAQPITPMLTLVISDDGTDDLHVKVELHGIGPDEALAALREAVLACEQSLWIEAQTP